MTKKNELATVKAENQLLSNSIKENVKYCIDPSNKTVMQPNTDIMLPHDAYVCLEMSAAWDSYCKLFVNDVIIQQLGAEAHQRCRSAVSVVCKKGDKVRIRTHGGNGGVEFSCYFGLK
ncbi:hypothetical protein M9Y10_019075 [Tritrichomonas musculus]|uniref:Uncharacterized protein n=1 Tax=Tritrichomonas musculus TaxID=1915356 RepID=A0ABR2HIF8_9EUKA